MACECGEDEYLAGLCKAHHDLRWYRSRGRHWISDPKEKAWPKVTCTRCKGDRRVKGRTCSKCLGSGEHYPGRVGNPSGSHRGHSTKRLHLSCWPNDWALRQRDFVPQRSGRIESAEITLLFEDFVGRGRLAYLADDLLARARAYKTPTTAQWRDPPYAETPFVALPRRYEERCRGPVAWEYVKAASSPDTGFYVVRPYGNPSEKSAFVHAFEGLDALRAERKRWSKAREWMRRAEKILSDGDLAYRLSPLDYKDGRIAWWTAPPKPKVTWPLYHWHCEHCRSVWLGDIIRGLKPARLVSKLFHEVNRLAIVTELPQKERKRWNGMRWRWTALCWICGEQRRNRPWITCGRHGDKIHSHVDCRHAQLRGRRKYTKAQVEAPAKGRITRMSL